MLFVRSLLFQAFWVIWTVSLGLTLPILLILPREQVWKISRLWVRGTFLLLRVFCGISYELRGKEHLPEGPAIFASKHQSAWETMLFALLLDRPAYVLKQELLRIPVYGAFVRRMDQIAIDRSKGDDALKQLTQQARHIFALGRSIVIFPEGTRVKPGLKRKYRKRGITTLYSKFAQPVVPVALNSGLIWGRNSLIKRPGRIVVQILPPMPEGLEPDEFALQLQERMDAATDKLITESVTAQPTLQTQTVAG